MLDVSRHHVECYSKGTVDQDSERDVADGKQSPGDKGDYEGLQLDTRAREITDKHLDPAKPFKLGRTRDSQERKHGYFNEKEVGFDEKGRMQMHMSANSPTSPSSTMVGGETPHDLHYKSIDGFVGKPPPPENRKICGLQRRTFWIVFSTCFVAVVAAAVIGGVLGARRRNTPVDTPQTPTPASGAGASASPPNSAAVSSASAAATLV